ncbi:hypothetical protein NDK43_06880 [Neobacillus pocheonensis]|uniref:Uncharacterized protein n=1 Tax=Neobacillus pocheonensis TaxID=363869 RepID=A0ABT0W778_9BACI|nr:hypothetical protein [Neobacillus pocheonensis]
MNKSVEYSEKVLSGEIVAPSQVRQACKNFLHEFKSYSTKKIILTSGIPK